MNAKDWGSFWTLARLKQLRGVLNEAAKKDGEGFYFGPIGLKAHVRIKAASRGLSSARTVIREGLNFLVVLGVLEEGRGGPLPPDYKRRYHPAKLDSVTESDVEQYRRKRRAGGRGMH